MSSTTFWTTSSVLVALGAIILWLVISHPEVYQTKSRVVRISTGDVQGTVESSRNGTSYFSFKGIPYGQSTAGDLRFEPPKPAQPWKWIYQANKFGSPCLQTEAMITNRILGSEDCLFVNVFTPSLDRSKGLDVMVWIHGGGFTSGESSNYLPDYFMDHEIIIVSMNYRLGALGFLNTGDGYIKGNMGMKDQTLALKWVQENIKNFGGDPNRVTIMGESAGGASVHYHMVSPLSQGLFHKAISFSGTWRSPWSITMKHEKQAEQFAEAMGCPIKGKERVDCLKSKDPVQIVKAKSNLMSPLGKKGFHFTPTIEVQGKDAFLPESPFKLEAKGDYKKVPWLLGITSGEGGLRTARVEAESNGLQTLEENWNEHAPKLLTYEPNDVVSTKLKTYYLDGLTVNENRDEYMKKLTDMCSDSMFIYPARESAIVHSKVAPTYFYYYNYVAGMPSLFTLFRSGNADSWLPAELTALVNGIVDAYKKYTNSTSGPHNYGPCHGDDLLQLWIVNPVLRIRSFNSDFEFSRDFVKAVVDFAKNDAPKFQDIAWPPLKQGKTLKIMELNSRGKVITEPYSERMDFWKSLKIRQY